MNTRQRRIFTTNFDRLLQLIMRKSNFETAKVGSTTFESKGHTRFGHFIFSMIEGDPLGRESGDVWEAKQQIKLHGDKLHGDKLHDVFPCIVIYFIGEIMGQYSTAP